MYKPVKKEATRHIWKSWRKKRKFYQISWHYHRWNLNGKSHIEVVENKSSRNIGVLYSASHLLDFKKLLKIYFSFIHIYISYANIASASTFKNKLQGILKKQKHAGQITFHANRLDHAKPLLKEMKALNVYQISLIQALKFMHKTKYGKNPRVFLLKFREVDHQYPTRFSQNSFCYKRSPCKTTSFAITSVVQPFGTVS